MTDQVVEVVAPSRRYEVVVGSGILGSHLGKAVAAAPAAEKAVVVTDDGLPGRWVEVTVEGLQAAGLAVETATFPAGEASKNLTTLSSLLVQMAEAGLHRRDVVVGLGGGVVTDVAGFAASVYMRGVGFLSAPTTLLGMVDAAVGGKTGVNLEGWKNLVGTFCQPLGVVADVETLETLSEREVRTGLAEVVKYGFISDGKILETVRALGPTMLEDNTCRSSPEVTALVADCVRAKAGIVSADETESGTREVLNFGHTLGHALERATANRLTHGEAIAVGMVFDAELSRLEGLSDLRERVETELDALGLPTAVEGVSPEAVWEAMEMDKKYAAGLRFVLLEAVGKPVVVRVVDRALIEKALASVGIGRSNGD